MSHITKVVTSLDDLKIAALAVQFLGLSCVENPSNVIVNTNGYYDITLEKIMGKIQVKADSIAYFNIQKQGKISKFMGKTRYLDENKFSTILKQAYNVIKAQQQALTMGHKMILSEPDESGNIHAQIVVN